MSDDDWIEGTDQFDPEVIASESTAESKLVDDHERELRAVMEIRRLAYAAVFNAGAPSREQRELVLQDLMRFCRAETSTYATNPRDHAMLEGRREVWLRINNHATKTTEQLLDIYNPKG